MDSARPKGVNLRKGQVILNRGLMAVGLTVKAWGAEPVGVAMKQESLKVI